MISADDKSILHAVFQARRRQVALRVGFTVSFCFIYGRVLGWAPAVIWMTSYLALQALERVLDRKGRLAESPFAMPLLFVQSVAFGSLSLYQPNDRAGWVLGVLLMMGGLMNVALTSRRSQAVFVVNAAPLAIYLQVWPLRSLLAGDRADEVVALSLSTILAVVYSWLIWRSSARSIATAAQACAEAESAAAAKSDFLANMSHELRTPLNGVVATASVLARTDLTSAQADMVRVVRTSAECLRVVLSDVLDLSKIESGHIDLRTDVTSPSSLARHVATLFAAPSTEKGLSFELDVDPESEGAIMADGVRVTQILTNLCSNAVKFTERGGVRLIVRTTVDGDDRKVTFKVADTGIGLTPAAMARIFERFTQADGSITRRFGGTGLGLAISRQLAEKMGGAIEVESTVGVGSVFTATMRFPAATTTEPGPGPVANPAGDQHTPFERRATPPRVLLVEDHPVNRQVMRLMLDDLVSLDIAEDGSQGLEAVKAHSYDVILMDMEMPVMDGLTATRAIRQIELETGKPRTPIIMLTANAMAEHAKVAGEAGVDIHLAKPITLENLFAALDSVFSAERSPSPARAGEEIAAERDAPDGQPWVTTARRAGV